jgi:hypothetical protein
MPILGGVQAGSAQAEVPLPLSALEAPREMAEWVAWPPLRGIVQGLGEPGTRLVIRHPGGDRGTLRARELAARLQALGVAPGRLELRPGGAAAALELTIETTEKGNAE